MLIGFTFDEKQKEVLQKKCDTVVVSPEGISVTKTFARFVKEHPNADICLNSWEDANMQLAQLYPGMTVLKHNQKLLYFIKKTPLPHLSDEDFFDVLYKFATIEIGLMKTRTEKGVALAKDQGLFPGRPRIAQTVIEKIERLYKARAMTFQEIASECHVSVGTVHKYVVKLRARIRE